jgi:hypothetical protein
VRHRLLKNLAIQDLIALAFHAYMLLRAVISPPGSDAEAALIWTSALLSVTVATIVLCRSKLLPGGRARALIYRVGLFAPVALTYAELRPLLAGLQATLRDDVLYAIDRVLFGETPAVWLGELLNTSTGIEWFGFFYYSYYFLLAFVLVPSLFLDNGQRLREVMYAALLVVALGHCGYTLVPALGPYAYLDFDAPIHEGFFFGLITRAVESGGAMLDIFPSLHTALPTTLTLFLYGNRNVLPHRYAWPVYAFFAANIVVATMLLRWHWGIDVVAGIVLAALARWAAVKLASHEAVRDGEQDRRQPVWEPLSWRTSSMRA